MSGRMNSPYDNDRSRRQRRESKSCPPGVLAACVALVLISALVVSMLWIAGPSFESDKPNGSEGGSPIIQNPEQPGPDQTESEEPSTEPTETEPEPVHVIATATVMSTGDVLTHMPVVNACKTADGGYDFAEVFQYISPYVTEADYAVANLETTLAGTDNGYPYSGYPCFNCPDEVVDGAMGAGFDMFATANNHCYDTRHVGLTRTLKVLEEKGMDSLGTMNSAEDPKFVIQDINGIKIGMICYTYSSTMESGLPNINGIPMNAQSEGMINTFDATRLDVFYTDIQNQLKAMEEAGAEATIVYMHWGYEYQLVPSEHQTKMAQKLCDFGVDVIIGGHPHVIQPVDLLTSSTDPEHKTVCLYSMGNAVSNQRLGLIKAIGTAHTEDGVLFSVTFSKYSDGTVVLEGTDLIPCWVNMFGTGIDKQYNILPLDDETRDQWQTLYGLSDTGVTAAGNSYKRTMDLVGEGLEECQSYLAQAKADREAAYLAEVQK